MYSEIYEKMSTEELLAHREAIEEALNSPHRERFNELRAAFVAAYNSLMDEFPGSSFHPERNKRVVAISQDDILRYERISEDEIKLI